MPTSILTQLSHAFLASAIKWQWTLFYNKLIWISIYRAWFLDSRELAASQNLAFSQVTGAFCVQVWAFETCIKSKSTLQIRCLSFWVARWCTRLCIHTFALWKCRSFDGRDRLRAETHDARHKQRRDAAALTMNGYIRGSSGKLGMFAYLWLKWIFIEITTGASYQNIPHHIKIYRPFPPCPLCPLGL